VKLIEGAQGQDIMPKSALKPKQSGRRAAAGWLAACLAVLLCGAGARAQSVAFINPGKSNEIYWMTVTQGMQAAARSLGMTFEVQYAEREPLRSRSPAPWSRAPPASAPNTS
jgi:hypothetical protein